MVRVALRTNEPGLTYLPNVRNAPDGSSILGGILNDENKTSNFHTSSSSGGSGISNRVGYSGVSRRLHIFFDS